MVTFDHTFCSGGDYLTFSVKLSLSKSLSLGEEKGKKQTLVQQHCLSVRIPQFKELWKEVYHEC